MKTNKKELLRKLEIVKPGVANKEIIEFTDSFSFTGTSLLTFNDAICMNIPFESEFEGTVKADQFFKIVRKLAPDKDGNLSLDPSDTELIISGKRAKSGVLYNENGSLPLEEVELPEKWLKLPKDFIKGLKMSLFCVSNDASMPLMTCVNIDGNIMQASNGIRIFQYELESKIKHPFLIPADRANTVTKYNIIKYNVDDNWAHFKTKEGLVISARVYQEEEYPEIEELLNIKGGEFIFPATMTEVVDRAVVFCDGDLNADATINIDIKSKLVLVHSKSPKGWFKEKIPNKSSVEVNFQINAFFLLDILKETRKCVLSKMEKDDDNTSSGFLEFKSTNWNHIIRIESKK